MKKRGMIILGLLLAGFIVFQGVVKKNTDSVGQWPYSTLQESGEYEVRSYEKVIMASVTKPGSMDKAMNGAFRDLAGYIFGGNKEEQQVAMTSPVVMDDEQGEMSMHFIMPPEYDKQELPEPINGNIEILESTAFIAATVTFGGFASEKDFEEKAQQLLMWCEENGLETTGKCRYLGYDPPFKLVDRRNEVLVQLERDSLK